MVKIPNLDDLKKMGSGFIDSAKSVKFGEVVDKFKSGMESVGIKKTVTENASGDDELKAIMAAIQVSLNELLEAEKNQAQARKKLQTQMTDLEKIIGKYQKIPESPTVEKEEPKEP